MSFAEYKRQFKTNPSVNPETGRKITIGGDKYNKLKNKYFPEKSSPKRTTLVKRSPRKSPRKSPRLTRKDPFEVLPEESIVRVLHNLSEENRLIWANSSAKVRDIYNRMF